MTLTCATKSIKVKVTSPEAHCSSATRSELGSLDLLVESDTLGNGVPAGRNLYLPTQVWTYPSKPSSPPLTAQPGIVGTAESRGRWEMESHPRK